MKTQHAPAVGLILQRRKKAADIGSTTGSVYLHSGTRKDSPFVGVLAFSAIAHQQDSLDRHILGLISQYSISDIELREGLLQLTNFAPGTDVPTASDYRESLDYNFPD